jgi:hypothetical protein
MKSDLLAIDAIEYRKSAEYHNPDYFPMSDSRGNSRSTKEPGLFGVHRPNGFVRIRSAMKTLDRQELDVVNKTQSNSALRDWRGHFMPEFVRQGAESVAES